MAAWKQILFPASKGFLQTSRNKAKWLIVNSAFRGFISNAQGKCACVCVSILFNSSHRCTQTGLGFYHLQSNREKSMTSPTRTVYNTQTFTPRPGSATQDAAREECVTWGAII